MINASNQQVPQSERRTDVRVKKAFILSCYEIDDPDRQHDLYQARDISKGGVCFATSKPMAPSTKLGLRLKTPFQSTMLYLRGHVIESIEKAKDLFYETRVAFADLDVDAQTILQQVEEKGDTELAEKILQQRFSKMLV